MSQRHGDTENAKRNSQTFSVSLCLCGAFKLFIKGIAMKRASIAALWAALFVCGSTFAADPPPANPNDELIKRLGGQGEPATKTAEEFEAAYAKVLPQLLAKPERDDVALQRISFRASRPGAEVEREALAKVLANKLTAADATGPAKVVLLRHLER